MTLAPVRESYVQHPVYYFEDGNIVLLIFPHLFCLHRSQLTTCAPNNPRWLESEWTDETPLDLGEHKEITAENFSQLLTLIYPLGTFSNERNTREWIDILIASGTLGFDKIFNDTVACLTTKFVDPMERLSLLQKYKIESWTLETFVELSFRPQPLSDDEVMLLQPLTIGRFYRAREEVTSHIDRKITNYPTWPCDNNACRHALKTAFEKMYKESTTKRHAHVIRQAYYSPEAVLLAKPCLACETHILDKLRAILDWNHLKTIVAQEMQLTT